MRPVGRLGVDEHGPDGERRHDDVHARVPEEVELARLRRQAVGADQRAHRQPEPGQRQGGVGHAAAEPPAAGIVVDEVPARGPDHDHDRHIGHSASVGPDRDPAYTGRNERHRASAGRPAPDRGPSSCTSTSCTRATPTPSPTSCSPARTRWSPRSSSTSSSRSAAGSSTRYEHETLVEAIADELERDHDFITISDDRLTAAVNVSRDEEENFLADLEAPESDPDYVSILADLQGGDNRLN